MRQLSAIAAILASLACAPLLAQHGGSHGGGGGFSHGGSSSHFSAPSSGFHSAPSSGFRRGFNSTPPARFNGSSPSFRPSRPGMPSNFRSPAYRSPYNTRPAYSSQNSGRNQFRLPYRGPGGNRNHGPRYSGYWNSPYAIPFLYPNYGYDGWLDSGFYNDSDNYGDNYVTNPNYPGDNYGGNDPGDGQQYGDPAQDYDQSASVYPGTYPNQGFSPRPEYDAPPSQASVTLVFKDGRPAEQIHNYMLSRTTLTVLDQGRHDIPVDQLDLAATEKANRTAGIDFHLPAVD
jgi:hypothetical protein